MECFRRSIASEEYVDLRGCRQSGIVRIYGQFSIPRSTIYDHLERGNFTGKHSRWVTHTLEECAKPARVDMANSMLKMITEARHQSWRYFLTGDELWFFIQQIMNKCGSQEKK
jgi:hypothetical protein